MIALAQHYSDYINPRTISIKFLCLFWYDTLLKIDTHGHPSPLRQMKSLWLKWAWLEVILKDYFLGRWRGGQVISKQTKVVTRKVTSKGGSMQTSRDCYELNANKKGLLQDQCKQTRIEYEVNASKGLLRGHSKQRTQPPLSSRSCLCLLCPKAGDIFSQYCRQ